MVMKTVDSLSLEARQEKHGYENSSHHLTYCKHVALILMVAAGFVLYTRFLLEDAMQRANFPGFLASNSPANDNLYFSFNEEADDRNEVRSAGLAPPASPILSTDNLNDTGTKPRGEAPATTGGDDSNRITADPGTHIDMQSPDVPDESIAIPTVTNAPAKFSVLVGVFIRAYEMKRREIIRLAYRVQPSPDADFTVRFILGGYKLESWLEGENTTYGDMIVLQCTENLNAGKTFTFFSSLPDLGYEYDYVMKADDDSYVHFANLGKHLKPFPRTDLYYGYSLPCDDDDPGHVAGFRVGAGYILSWDLVVWIKDSPIPRNNSIGTEDYLVGKWFKEGDVAKNRPYSMHLFHDHPDQVGRCARPLTKESILIHKLKTDERWYEVIDFFNASRSLNN